MKCHLLIPRFISNDRCKTGRNNVIPVPLFIMITTCGKQLITYPVDSTSLAIHMPRFARILHLPNYQLSMVQWNKRLLACKYIDPAVMPLQIFQIRMQTYFRTHTCPLWDTLGRSAGNSRVCGRQGMSSMGAWRAQHVRGRIKENPRDWLIFFNRKPRRGASALSCIDFTETRPRRMLILGFW